MNWSRRIASRLAVFLAVPIAAALASACGDPDTEALPADDPKSGGNGTIFDDTREAFARPLGNLHGERRDDFFLGNSIFNRGWVTAPASVSDFDGLGPLFNATSCSGCHFKDGRGRPPEGDAPFLSILVRLSIPGKAPNGGPLPEPVYGDQLQTGGVLGVPPEGSPRVRYVEVAGTFADGATFALQHPSYTFDKLGYGPLHPAVMISPRTAPFLVGLGMLEALSEAAILAHADPDDRDGDGISGRPNLVWDEAASRTVLGRFGWKANQPNLRQQNAGAFLGDMGITSSLFSSEACSATQGACASAPVGSTSPQLREVLFEQVTYYTRTLGVPGRRDVERSDVRRGRQLFDAAGCAGCHVPTFETGELAGFPEVSHQTIHPFTDLLLHDMGPELADGRPDFEASGSEWRTPPLWGIGLVSKVNRHDLYLHDGRARGFAEAILWHGGEGERSREAFRSMPASDRDAILAFLRSL